MSEFSFMPPKKPVNKINVRIGDRYYYWTDSPSIVYKQGELVADVHRWYINDELFFGRYYVRILDLHMRQDKCTIYLIDAEAQIELASRSVTFDDYGVQIVWMIAEYEHWTTRDYVQHGLAEWLSYTDNTRIFVALFGTVNVRVTTLGDAFYYQFNMIDFRYERDDGVLDDDDDFDHVQIVNSKIFYMDEVQPSLQHLITVIISSMREVGKQ